MKIISTIIFLIIIEISAFAQNNDLFNRFRLAQSYEQVNEYQKAEAIYEELYNKQPQNFQFFDALNRVYIQLKEYDKSVSMLEKRIADNPMDINLYGLLGSTYFQKGEEDKAYDIWDKALSQMPQNQVNYRVIANYAIERRDYNKAIEILNKGKELNKETFNFSYDLANLYSILMKYKEAADEYCFILNKEPNQLNIIEAKMSGYVSKPEAAKPTIDIVQQWMDKNQNNFNFYYLQSWLFMESGDFNKAYEIYVKLDSKKQNAGADLFSFAQRAYQEDHFDISSKAYKKIVDDYPSSPFIGNARIGYAKTTEAVLDKKLSVNDSWKPFYAPSPERNSEFNEVVDAYRELINTYPKSEIENEAYYRIGMIELEKLNNIAEAEVSFNKLIEISPISTFIIPAKKELAEISILRNDLKKAQNYYNEIISNSRASAADKNFSTFMLSKINFWNGNFDQASVLLKQVVTNLADNYANDAIELSAIINTTKHDSLNLLSFAKAELFTEQNKFKEASEIYSELSKNNNLLTIQDLSALRNAEMMEAMDKLPESVSMLKEISDDKSTNIYADKALFLMGEVYQYGIQDNNLAMQAYEKLLANFPNSLYLDDTREKINSLKKESNNL